MSLYEKQFTGVVSKNSIDYVRKIFELNVCRKPVLLLRSSDDERSTAFNVESIVEPEDEKGWAELSYTSINEDALAQLSFTSGTEGEPKGIALSYANQHDAVERLQSVMSVDESIREYIGVPVYHSFGFGRCRLVSSVGGRFFVPANGFDCFEIQSMLKEGQINSISAVPSLWRVLLQSQEIFGDERLQLRWIEIGSQYMSAAEKKSLKDLFPKANIIQHYGLTEASRATFLNISDIDDDHILESVGKVVGDTQLRLAADGAVEIKGRVVAKEMLQGGRSHALCDSEGWLSTNDLGEMRDGYLYYKGRKDDMINCGGIKLYAESIEKELRAQLDIASGLACSKFPHELRGDGLLIAYEPSIRATPEQISQAAERILQERGVSARGALRVEVLDQLPVTVTGKIQRNKILSLLANSSTSIKVAEAQVGPENEKYLELKSLWCQILGLENISIDESFSDLGGDSLTAITAVFKMKKLGVPEETARAILQGATIREIIDRRDGAELCSSTELRCDTALQIKVVRGLLVLIVIAAHWSGGVIERLPDDFMWLKTLFAPVFASGTPGFAVMYGVAIGFSFLPLYMQSPRRLYQLLKPIAGVLLAGITALWLIRMGVMLTSEEPITATRFFNAFFGVLTYYLLVTLTLPCLFFVATRYLPVVLASVLGAIFFHLAYLVVFDPLTQVPATGVVEFVKLLVAAKYSYFNMTGGVLLGVAIGFALHKDYIGSSDLMLVGLPLLAIAILLSISVGDGAKWLEWPTARVPAWRWLLYASAGVLIMYFIYRFRAYFQNPLLANLLKLLGTIGMLAFPFYVLHELVIPSKYLLVNLGLNEGVALLLPMSLFLLFAALMVAKSKRLMFS